MRQRPILSAANDFLSVRIDDQDASTGIRPNIWFAFLVGGHVPGDCGAAPVVENGGVGGAPLCPVHLIMRVVIVGAALRIVHFDFGMSGVHLARHAGIAGVGVPCDSVGVSAKVRIIELRDNAAPIYEIVIEDPNLGGSICLL